MQDYHLFRNRLSSLARWSHRFWRPRSRLFLGSENRSKGQGLVEFALVLPILLLLVMGIIEFGYLLAAYTSLFNASREGIRYGIVQPKDQAGIVVKAREKIFLVDPNRATIYVAYDNGPDTSVFTDTEQIKAGRSRLLLSLEYELPTITPMIQPFARTIHVQTQAARTIASTGDIETMNPGGGTWFGGGGEGGGGDAGGDDSPSITISAAADPQTTYSGNAVLFTYTVINNGATELTNVTITDGFGNTITVGTLAAGASTTETVSENVDATTTNEVWVTGVAPDTSAVSDNDSVTVTVINPALELTVEADPGSVFPGDVVTFTYTVVNTGDTNLTGVSVVDSWDTSATPIDLAPGESVLWMAHYLIYEQTTNNVATQGTDPLGGTVADSESITIQILDMAPVRISEPLVAGQTVVTGTAHVGQSVFIYDPEDPAVTGSYTVGEDGRFQFSVPPLQPGHVIVVGGYGMWDSAVVQGSYAPVVLGSLCHGDTVLTGTAQAGQTVDLSIAALGYNDSVRVGLDGEFTFTLSGGVFLQMNQVVVVSGYGTSDQATVAWCGTDTAYTVIAPQCGDVNPSTIIAVDGYNWGTGNHRQVRIFWNDEASAKKTISLARAQTSFTGETITVDVPAFGEYTVRAELWVKSNCCYVPTGVQAEATFVSPCPSPNLVVTDVELVTTEPISTHQSIDFRVTVVNTGSMPVNNLFWVDLYSAIPNPAPSSGFAWGAVSSLDPGEETTLVITARDGFAALGEYQVWAQVDSWALVSECLEDDNVSGPISLTVSQEGEEPSSTPAGTGAIIGETRVLLSTEPVPHRRARVWCIDAATGEEVASTTSGETAQYMLRNLPPGSYLVMAETWIDGTRYFGIVLTPIEVGEGELKMANIVMQ